MIIFGMVVGLSVLDPPVEKLLFMLVVVYPRSPKVHTELRDGMTDWLDRLHQSGISILIVWRGAPGKRLQHAPCFII